MKLLDRIKRIPYTICYKRLSISKAGKRCPGHFEDEDPDYYKGYYDGRLDFDCVACPYRDISHRGGY